MKTESDDQVADAWDSTSWDNAQCQANAAFIAAARTGWPAALDEVERLRELLAAAIREREEWRECHALELKMRIEAEDAERLRELLAEVCGVADTYLMPNQLVSRAWYLAHADNRETIARIEAIRNEARIV